MKRLKIFILFEGEKQPFLSLTKWGDFEHRIHIKELFK